MSRIAKALCITMILVLTVMILPACGPKGYSTNISASQGGTAQFNSISLGVPPGAVGTDTKIQITEVKEAPALFAKASKEELELAAATYPRVGPVYNVEMKENLSKPVTVQLSYSTGGIPQGFSESDLLIAHYVDGDWLVEPSKVNTQSKVVSAEIGHFSPLTLVLVTGAMILTGAWVIFYSLLSKPAFIGIAHKYLTPEDSGIKQAVSGGSFVVDIAAKKLTLSGKTLKIAERSRLVKPKTGAEMFKDPVGMCEDYSNLFGSLLIAAGYPVRAVGGNATYHIGDKTISGGHAWIEVLIDGKVYYVDTFDPNKGIFLIPIEEARTTLTLKPGKMWGKTAGGKAIESVKYSGMWPLLGDWKVTRKSITPQLPVPEMAVDTVIPKSATWNISLENDKLKLRYDGKDIWYNTFGIKFTTVPVEVTEDPAACKATFDGGASASLDQIPLALNLVLSALKRKIEQVSLDVEDVVKLSFGSDNKLAVEIGVDASGKYYGEGEIAGVMRWKEFSASGTIIYTGERKE